MTHYEDLNPQPSNCELCQRRGIHTWRGLTCPTCRQTWEYWTCSQCPPRGWICPNCRTQSNPKLGDDHYYEGDKARFSQERPTPRLDLSIAYYPRGDQRPVPAPTEWPAVHAFDWITSPTLAAGFDQTIVEALLADLLQHTIWPRVQRQLQRVRNHPLINPDTDGQAVIEAETFSHEGQSDGWYFNDWGENLPTLPKLLAAIPAITTQLLGDSDDFDPIPPWEQPD